jgi:hypothetical protein
VPRNLLLMTATIRPPEGAIGLTRTDPETRLGDYLGAMSFYLDQVAKASVAKIIFVDNSDSAAALGRIEELVGRSGLSDRVELISYFGLDYPPSYGRTYGELKLIDRAYELSRTLASRGPDDVVWKVTGRYTVRPIERIIRKRPGDADLYCNARKYPRRYADLYLLSWTEDGYQNFLRGIYEKLRVDNTIEPGEALFYDLLGEASGRIKVVPRFNVTPYIAGIRGFNNRPFDSKVETWKFWLRRSLRRVAPWLWV